MIKSVDEFIRLRESEDPDEYHRAAHEEAPIEVWVELIDAHPDMRFWVVHNKTVPLSILATLSKDPTSRVRGIVAGKRKLSAELQIQIASDKHSSVRYALACNAKVTEEVLRILATDQEEFVREEALDRLKTRKSGG